MFLCGSHRAGGLERSQSPAQALELLFSHPLGFDPRPTRSESGSLIHLLQTQFWDEQDSKSCRRPRVRSIRAHCQGKLSCHSGPFCVGRSCLSCLTYLSRSSANSASPSRFIQSFLPSVASQLPFHFSDFRFSTQHLSFLQSPGF